MAIEMAINMKQVRQQDVIPELCKQLGYRNALMVPRIKKVVINTGVGRLGEKEKETIAAELALIAGQKLAPAPAHKPIASFKIRKGETIGFRATLRGRRREDFLRRMVQAAIPRMRDFRGIRTSAVDEYGNLNLGFRDHTVFPEMIGRDTRMIFGLQVTVVTSARSREEALTLFRLLGFPFRKES